MMKSFCFFVKDHYCSTLSLIGSRAAAYVLGEENVK